MQAIIAETLSPLTSSSWLFGVLPHRLYPYFRSVLRLSAPVSSTKTIISLEYTDTSEVHCSLRNLSCCNATLCNFFRVNPFSCKNLQMVHRLTSIISIVFSCLWTSSKYMAGLSTTSLSMKSWAGCINFLNAFSLEYGRLQTLLVFKNSCTVLWTVDLSTPRSVAIWS